MYDPRRLFGVTTLDVLRASTFVAESQGWPARSTDVTVIGGHAGTTILPLLSSVSGAKLTQAQIEALTFRIQFGGDEVVKAKDGAGSATLSMAQAADRFTGAVLRALKGETGISECAFVQSGAVPGTAYFSTRITLTVSARACAAAAAAPPHLHPLAFLSLSLSAARRRGGCAARAHALGLRAGGPRQGRPGAQRLHRQGHRVRRQVDAQGLSTCAAKQHVAIDTVDAQGV